jgi:hypothetical protein
VTDNGENVSSNNLRNSVHANMSQQSIGKDTGQNNIKKFLFWKPVSWLHKRFATLLYNNISFQKNAVHKVNKVFK